MLPTPIVIALAAGIVITLLQFWLNAVGDATSAKPHEVPIAVVGSGPAVQQLAAQLRRDDAFRVRAAADEAAAIQSVERRKVDGIVNVDARVVQTVSAASVPATGALEKIFSTRPGYRVSEIKPLPRHDPTGVGLLFLALAFGLGGLPAGAIFTFLSESRRPTSAVDAVRRMVLVVSYGGALSLAVAAVAVPLLGYTAHQFFDVWGWGALLTAACMAIGLVLTALVGLPGVPLGLLVIFFGVPSSPIPTQPWSFASGPYRVLGPCDPVGAAVDGLRNSMFFRDPSMTRDLLVLFVWLGIPLLVLLVLGWRAGRLSLARVQPTMFTAQLATSATA
jgi:hypothetical protein